MENVMKNLVLAAAAATMVFAVSPVFASRVYEESLGGGASGGALPDDPHSSKSQFRVLINIAAFHSPSLNR
jgi:hypothetical protein